MLLDLKCSVPEDVHLIYFTLVFSKATPWLKARPVSFRTINFPHLIKNPGFSVRRFYLQQQAPCKTPRIGNTVLKYIAQ